MSAITLHSTSPPPANTRSWGSASRVAAHYLSGSTALCIPWRGIPALWYSSALARPQSWCVAGYNMPDTTPLLGLAGVHDASHLLRDYGIEAPLLWAATHERAVFDLLYQHSHLRASPPPNVQASDIDDVVDLGQVRSWLHEARGFLGEESLMRALWWLDA